MEKNQVRMTNTEQSAEIRKPSAIVLETYEWIESIIFAVAIVILIFTFILRPVGVLGDSMKNTLHSGDKVIISKIHYTPSQGDIVVLSTPAIDTPIIKRVVAIGGQTVNIDYAANKVYVNGKTFFAPIIGPMVPPGYAQLKFPLKVPVGCVFVMGDNRNDSLDSRSTEIGIIKDSDIIGHAIFRIMPFSDFGMLK